MSALLREIRLAVRALSKARGFTSIALLALSLSVGANTAMFSITRAVLLRPLPYPSADALVWVQTVLLENGTPIPSSPPDFYVVRAGQQSFTQVGAWYDKPVVLTGRDQPERLRAGILSAELLPVLGVGPVLGRGFDRSDEVWGSHRSVILSDALWHSRFAGDPAVLGRTLSLDGEPHLVVGVLPPSFTWLDGEAQLFLPMAFEPGDNMNTHNNYFLRAVGRLRPGVTVEQARRELQGFGERIRAEFPATRSFGLDGTALLEATVASVRPAVLVLFGAVGLVLLIACANLAHLQLVRGAARRKDMVIHAALGATRSALLRQLLVESLVLGLAGGAVGLLVAVGILRAANGLSQEALPRMQPIGMEWSVLGFALLASLGTAVLFGLLPAIRASSVRIADSLGEAVRDAGGGHRRLSAALVVAETAFSLILLTGAGLTLKSLHHLLQVDLGHEPRGLVSAEIDLPASRYRDATLARALRPGSTQRASVFLDDLLAGLGRIPEVRAAGAISSLPLAGDSWSKRFVAWDRPLPATVGELPRIEYRVVAGDYFRALGIPVRGRTFTRSDDLEAPLVAIVSQSLARRIWGTEDPVGKLISVNPPRELEPGVTRPSDYRPEKLTVVGVAGDVPYDRLERGPTMVVYAPYAQGAEGQLGMYLALRTAGDPLSVVPAVREEVRRLDPDQPLAAVSTFESELARAVAAPRLRTLLLGIYAAIALALAAIGIYGVIAVSVVQRTREIGIRLAVGALPRTVLRLFLGRGCALAGIGLSLGLLGALVASRLARSLLFAVSPTDPLVFGGTALILGATALLASYLPARRAARVDPMETLREG
jgi:putative ABC transport system permease protein